MTAAVLRHHQSDGASVHGEVFVEDLLGDSWQWIVERAFSADGFREEAIGLVVSGVVHEHVDRSKGSLDTIEQKGDVCDIGEVRFPSVDAAA